MDLVDGIKALLTDVITPIVQDAVAQEVPKVLVKEKKRYYTIREVCAMLNICEATVHNWARNGGIEKIKDGKEVKLDANAIDAAIESGELGRYKHRRASRW